LVSGVHLYTGASMRVDVHSTTYRDVEALRALYRAELDCQIIRDSFLSRGLADPYLILVDHRVGGYGAVSNKYDKGRVIEFYTLPYRRDLALPMFRELLATSGATQVEAQTNSPLMLQMVCDCARGVIAERVLFRDARTTNLTCRSGIFRAGAPTDDKSNGLDGEWVIEANGTIVAAGGFLCHYNPPYGDVYMAVAESAQRQGYGSYLVQELKRVCYEAGKKPAARCDVTNAASRRTLEKAGFLPCAHLVVGEVPVAT
jgi:GNAT superfamily N-acetyltransferase